MIIRLANDLITGKRALTDLTLDECVALIERFSGEDDVARLWSDAKFYALDDAGILEHARLGAKVALSCAEDDDEYWAAFGNP